MKTKLLGVLAAWLLLMSGAQANPITYSVDTSGSGSPWTGTFTFDAAIGGAAGYTALSMSENFFGDIYGASAVQANSGSSLLHLIGSGFGDDTTFNFGSLLGVNSWADISFTGLTQCFNVCGGGVNPYEFQGSLTVVSGVVPEPASLALLGLGLAGLAASRRRKQ